MSNFVEAKACLRCTHVASDNLFSLVLRDKADSEFVLFTSVDVAAQIATLIAAAMKEIQQAGREVKVPKIPETILNYTATGALDDDGGVILALTGSMTGPFLGRMPANAAKELSVLLRGSAEPPPSRSSS
jgi:hypothetical protein